MPHSKAGWEGKKEGPYSYSPNNLNSPFWAFSQSFSWHTFKYYMMRL